MHFVLILGIDEVLTTIHPDSKRRFLIAYTNRENGVSHGVYKSNNRSTYVGDELVAVAENRRVLESELDGMQITWLKQVHGRRVVRADLNTVYEADAMWTDEANIALGIQTADCVPMLLYSETSCVVAAAHCGWRGLAEGVIEALIEILSKQAVDLKAWIGPAICGACYEVRNDVLDGLRMSTDSSCVRLSPNPDRYLLNLPKFVEKRLCELGVAEVAQSDICTKHDHEFFSYRRDGTTGRMVSLIGIVGNR